MLPETIPTLPRRLGDALAVATAAAAGLATLCSAGAVLARLAAGA